MSHELVSKLSKKIPKTNDNSSITAAPFLTLFPLLHPQLVGIVSNGAESCTRGLPGIFTRVSNYIDWIYLAMDRAGANRVPRYRSPSPRESRPYCLVSSFSLVISKALTPPPRFHPAPQHSVPRLGVYPRHRPRHRRRLIPRNLRYKINIGKLIPNNCTICVLSGPPTLVGSPMCSLDTSSPSL